MKTMNMQFHATIEDIHELILSIINNYKYKICGIRYFPNFTIENIADNLEITDIKKYDYIVLSKNSIPIANNNYDFMKMQNNNLIIDIGTSDNGEIRESAISVFSETEIDSEWKRVINNYKKSLLKGAWVVNPNTNARAYYKYHRYTINAKKAYENGTPICPIAGWNKYELVSEDDSYK